MVAWSLAEELLRPLLLVLASHAFLLRGHRLLQGGLIHLVLGRSPVRRVVNPPAALASRCHQQPATGLTDVRMKFYFDFRCYPLTAVWMSLGFPKLVTVRAQPQTGCFVQKPYWRWFLAYLRCPLPRDGPDQLLASTFVQRFLRSPLMSSILANSGFLVPELFIKVILINLNLLNCNE